MKTTKCYAFLPVLFLLLLAGFSSTAQIEVIAGKSQTSLGDYRIKESQQFTLEGQSFKAYELSYLKSNNPILIYVADNENSRDYIVRSNHLEIKYVSRPSGFGVEPVLGKHMKYDNEINNFLMDPVAYKAQMNLFQGKCSEKEALETIARNFPKLLKNIAMLR